MMRLVFGVGTGVGVGVGTGVGVGVGDGFGLGAAGAARSLACWLAAADVVPTMNDAMRAMLRAAAAAERGTARTKHELPPGHEPGRDCALPS